MLKRIYHLLFLRNYRLRILRYVYPKRYRLSRTSIVSKHRFMNSTYTLLKIKAKTSVKHTPHNNEDLKSLLQAATRTGI